MLKGLLVYRINKDDIQNIGVIQKCLGQYSAFQKMGVETHIFWLSNRGIIKDQEIVKPQKLTSHTWSMYWFYLCSFGKWFYKLNDFKNLDFIYLRHPYFDPLLVHFLKKAKGQNPKLKILLEINTFPYDQEPSRFLHKLSLCMDHWYRKSAMRFIDTILSYGVEKNIWGIPVISIRNGLNLESIKVVEKEPRPGELRLIAVGNWSYWHGLDRLIEGMALYQSKEQSIKISLKIIGYNSEQFRKLIKERDLQEQIFLYPPTYGKGLDALFNESDMGVGTLGIHRKGVMLDSSLKNREYCGRGIPFIVAGKDPDFDPQLNFIHKIESNDEPLDVDKIVMFYKEGNLSSEEIRKYAEDNLSWEKQLSPVKEWLDSYSE